MRSLILAWLMSLAVAFCPRLSVQRTSIVLWSSETSSEQKTEPKEVVKLFGRLAEKYIMLDETAGMCCYSACSDCEYRLPDGGYRMADQSASRPKWIPSYESRSINGKDHTTKWSSEIFTSGPAVTKDEFVERLVQLDYAPTLGGPYVAASAAIMDNTATAERLFDILADGKDKLTKHKMSVRLKQLADGEEGLAWANFQSAFQQ